MALRVLRARGGDPDEEVPRLSLFTVAVGIEEGSTHVRFDYDGGTKHQDLILDWIDKFESLLSNMQNLKK